MTIDGWINKGGPSTQWNDSALKRKEILAPATPWMYLKDMMLSERSQTQKDNYCVIPLAWSPWRSEIHRK